MPFKCALCGKKSEVTANFMEWPDIENFHAEFYPVTRKVNQPVRYLGSYVLFVSIMLKVCGSSLRLI